MIVAAFLLVWWLIAAASGASYFATVDGIITSFLGDLVMALSVLGLWYHALGGVRHLIWDTGNGLDIESSDRMGWGMLIGSVVADLPDPDRDLRGKDMAYVTDRKRVTGLGAAKSGTHHFWTMTVTAVALSS
jgi:succinate dehydrogenase cytochrome b556 subunit